MLLENYDDGSIVLGYRADAPDGEPGSDAPHEFVARDAAVVSALMSGALKAEVDDVYEVMASGWQPPGAGHVMRPGHRGETREVRWEDEVLVQDHFPEFTGPWGEYHQEFAVALASHWGIDPGQVAVHFAKEARSETSDLTLPASGTQPGWL